jgi:hypothetical protein
MEPLALAGIVALLLVKEAGVPIPVPGDLVVVGTGAALAADAPAALLAVIGAVGWVLIRRRRNAAASASAAWADAACPACLALAIAGFEQSAVEGA